MSCHRRTGQGEFSAHMIDLFGHEKPPAKTLGVWSRSVLEWVPVQLSIFCWIQDRPKTT